MAYVSLDIDLGGVTRKLDQQAIRKGHVAMARQMLVSMYQYVPRRSTALRTSGHITPNGDFIVYQTKYAAKQFYVQHRNYSTPGTGSRWDLKAKGIHMDAWKLAYLRGAGIK